jgi:hypothetical protein
LRLNVIMIIILMELNINDAHNNGKRR